MGFAEFLIVAIVALLVLGPERMPHAVRNVYRWSNQLRQSFGQLKSDFERELNASELQRDLHNNEIMKQLNEGGTSLGGELDEIRKSMKDLPYDIDGPAEPSSDAHNKQDTEDSTSKP